MTDLTLTIAGQSYMLATRPRAPPAVLTDLQRAQRFFGRLAIGTNRERFRAFTDLQFQGALIGASPAWAAYFAGLGGTHARCFIPYGFSAAGVAGLTANDVVRMAGYVRTLVTGGLRVVRDRTDVRNLSEVAPGSAGNAALIGYLNMAASTLAGQGLDPDWVAVGAINECAGDSNANWLPVIQAATAVVRKWLPRHTLTVGAANWKYPGGAGALNKYDGAAGLCDGTFTPFGDMNIGYDLHSYDPSNTGAPADLPATWASSANAAAAWSAQNGGRPCFLGEFGWTSASGIIAASIGAGQLRPTLWTVTSGSGGRANVTPGDATLTPQVEASIRAGSAYIRSQPYFLAA